VRCFRVVLCWRCLAVYRWLTSKGLF